MLATDPEGYLARRKAQNKAWRERNAEQQRARNRAVPRELRMLYDAKSRAKRYGWPFNLDKSDVVIPDVCPVLGIPILRGQGAHGPNSPTLDRMQPHLGYVKGNVAVISFRANTLKNDASADDLERVAQWIRASGRARSP
jgi:hypothetical protein